MVVQSLPKVEEVEYKLQASSQSYYPDGWWVYYTNIDFEVVKQSFNASSQTTILPVKGTMCYVDSKSSSEQWAPTIIPEPNVLDGAVRPLFEA